MATSPHKILVASYTDNIYTLTFDPATHRLHVSSTVEVGHHPSWIAPHPLHESRYFAVLEGTEGQIVSLVFDAISGEGKVVGRVSSGGADPCIIVVNGNEALVGNYSSGALAIHPLSNIPPYLQSSTPQVVSFSGSGPNTDRQTSSHAHHVIVNADGTELLVADLGADKTWRLRREDGVWKVAGHVQYEPGSGPRHIAVHDGMLYSVLELTNKLARHRLSPLPEEGTFLESLSTLSQPPKPPTDMLCAEICIPPPNKVFLIPYIYVSNRNDMHPGGDTIAIFSIEPFQLVAEVRTGLKHVRGAVFGGPDDSWLIVGGVNSGGVKIFERVDGGRGLKEIASDASVKAPTGFVWL